MQNKTEVHKLIKNGIGFLIFSFSFLYLLQWGLGYLVKQSDNGQSGKINLIMSHQVDPDIMVLGSSVAEVGFNSNIIDAELNKTVYNAAIDGTTIIQSQFMINEFIQHSTNCKQILIGLAFFSFEEKKSMTEPSRYLAHFNNQHVKRNIKSIDPSFYQRLQYVPFYLFTQAKHTYYKNAALGFKNLIRHKTLEPDSLNGFVPHHTQWNDIRISENQFGSQSIGISKKTISDFINIIKKIQQKNIEPILVVTPMFVNGQKYFKNYNDFLATAKSISKETNITIWDFSKSEITTDDSLFYNNGHLNSRGAKQFSIQIADSLKSYVSISSTKIAN